MKLFKKAIETYLSKERIGRCDFHSHSFFSDGALLPMEQLRRAHALGHECYAITDHCSESNLDIIPKIAKDCELATEKWGLVALPGVEITHVPVDAIEGIAEKAREKGALVIVIHGETITEPVEPGTNLVAAGNKNIDILAHPGFLSKEEAKLCNKNNVFIEITSRSGHSLTNGHIVNISREMKVKFIQNTDTHSPNEMLDYSTASKILRAAGLSEGEAEKTMQDNVRDLLTKILDRL